MTRGPLLDRAVATGETHLMARTKPLKLLVAEDNVINQRLIVEMLRSLGHTGVVVGDGAKALKCLETLQFDLILMDASMPVMDGMEAISAIRAKEAESGGRIPIIVATAHDGPGDAGRFKRAGADGYLAKPIAVSKLESEILRVFGGN